MQARSQTILTAITTFFIFVQAPHAEEAFCKQQLKTCNERDLNCKVLCKADGFEVGVPDSWAAQKNNSKDIALHFISPNAANTGGNCPVVSMVNIDSMNAIQEIVNSTFQGGTGNFWSAVFRKAGFYNFSGDILNQKTIWVTENPNPALPDTLHWKDTVKRTKSWNDAWSYTSKDRWWVKPEGAMYSMVEIVFQTRQNGPVLRARQAIYYIPGTVKLPNEAPTTAGAQYVPHRVYFVNCTALNDSISGNPASDSKFIAMSDKCDRREERKDAAGFCDELESFNGIFRSFTPRRCYEPDSSTALACIPQSGESISILYPSPSNAAEYATLAQSQELINVGALVAKMAINEK